jgi:hypothetical protein
MIVVYDIPHYDHPNPRSASWSIIPENTQGSRINTIQRSMEVTLLDEGVHLKLENLALALV